MKRRKLLQKLKQLPDDALTRIEGWLGWHEATRPRQWQQVAPTIGTLTPVRTWHFTQPIYSNPLIIGKR